jgi:hypothetical protein
MKKALIFSGFVLALWSCNEGGNNSNTTSTDSATGSSPGAINDETQHPGGVTNQNVISRDTAAFNVERMSDTTKRQ